MKKYAKMLNKIEGHLENEDITMADTIMVLRNKNGNKWHSYILNWYTKLWFDRSYYNRKILKSDSVEEIEMLSFYKAQFDLERPFLEEMSVEELMKELERKIEIV